MCGLFVDSSALNGASRAISHAKKKGVLKPCIAFPYRARIW